VIKLRPFKLEDWQYLNQWISNESDLIQFAGPIFSFPIDQKQIENYLSDSNRIIFRVDTESGQTIGIAEISIETYTIVKLARILIGEKSLRGQGIGTELITTLTAYAFNKLKANKVILNVYSWNISAIRCYQKVGFSQTDKPITYIQVGNDEWETIEMGIHRNNFLI